ncbi:MAG: Hpt domain-containing protein [Blautia sp.]|nr:Hpt domain-containing protein [Blautia sp.]
MTLKELYDSIGGNYDQVIRVLRMDRLIDKHIRKFVRNNIVENVLEAGKAMDPVQLFEAAHAMKGVCSNLGLTNLADAASEISEEFRPGRERTMSNDDVSKKLEEIEKAYALTKECINRYAGDQ